MSNNPFSLTFTLKQHTPLIHFQHDQAGATLRATEVKPKLDQFLIEKLTGKRGFEAREKFHERLFADKPEWKEWLVGKAKQLKPSYENPKDKQTALEHMAFDYKMHFLSNGGKEVWEKSIINAIKNLVLIENNSGSIFCIHKALRSYIETSLVSFFVIHNFGFRQSKGYGSFTISSINDKVFQEGATQFGEILNARFSGYRRLDTRVRVGNSMALTAKKTSCEELLSKIDNVYKRLKSARDRNSGEKPFIFQYFCDRPEHIRWEKRFIKKQINVWSNSTPSQTWDLTLKNGDNPADCNGRSEEDTTTYNYRYTRALLGLAENFEFQTGRDDRKLVVVFEHDEVNDKVSIERFQSPVLFKVFENHVFVVLQEITAAPIEGVNVSIFDQPFKLSLNYKKKEWINGKQEWKKSTEADKAFPIPITTPSIQEFNKIRFKQELFEFLEEQGYINPEEEQ